LGRSGSIGVTNGCGVAPRRFPLPPKTFAVLCCLVTQAGQLVTKEALLAALL
jgi:DNA-binding response OmpR family regulator